MISSDALNPLLLEAFTHKITWLEAAGRYPLEEVIATFYATRERVTQSIETLSDTDVAYTSPVHPMWSISESITHLIYSQGFYHNKLLDISTSDWPHVIEAARGFGEGAKTGRPAEELRLRMAEATRQIKAAIENTRGSYDPAKTEVTEYFGVCNYPTWIFLLLSHEVDHLRQIIAMRRLARAEQS